MTLESQPGASANFKAQISVNPVLSQSVLVTLLLVSTLPLTAGFYFLWYDKDGTWIPFALFVAIIAIVSIGWWRSQSSIDMADARATKISDRHGNEVTTDSRVFESSNAVAQLGTLLQSIGVRAPLPEPDGLVDDVGSRIPNSKDRAVELVDGINELLSAQAQELVSLAARGKTAAIQEVIEPSVESNRGVLEHNQAGTGDPS